MAGNDSARRFIAALTGSEDTVCSFQTLDDWGIGDTRLIRQVIGRYRDVAGEIDAVYRDGAGVFICINDTGGKPRKSENVVGIRALFIDDDEDIIEMADISPSPSIVVRSRAGLHVYWRLRPGEDVELFRPAQMALADRYHTDRAVCDLPRVMRLPGYANRKDKSNPHMVTILHVSDREYTVRDVVGEVNVMAAGGLSRALVPARPDGASDRDVEVVMRCLGRLDPNCGYQDWIAIGQCIHSVCSDSRGFDLWKNWSSGATRIDSRGRPVYRGPKDLEMHWRSFSAGRRGLGTLCWMAGLRGVDCVRRAK